MDVLAGWAIGVLIVGGLLTVFAGGIPLGARWPQPWWPPVLQICGAAAFVEGILLFLLLAFLENGSEAAIVIVALLLLLAPVSLVRRVRRLRQPGTAAPQGGS